MKNNSHKNLDSLIPLRKWSKQTTLNNILLWDTQAYGKTTRKSKGTLNTMFREWTMLGRRPGDAMGRDVPRASTLLVESYFFKLSDRFLLLLSCTI